MEPFLFIQLVFFIVLLPYVVGRVVYYFFEIKNDGKTTNIWYTGVWSIVILVLVFSMVYKLIEYFFSI